MNAQETPRAQVSELYPGPKPATAPQSPSLYHWNHGSCVIAKVIGKTLGLARNAQVVIAQFNPDEYSDETWLDSVRMIIDDIVDKKREKTSVVNLSEAFTLKVSIDHEIVYEGVTPAVIDRLGTYAVLPPLLQS